MERIEIKLIECCLTCEYFSPYGDAFALCANPFSKKREIACTHMPVCYKYREQAGENYDCFHLNDCANDADDVLAYPTDCKE